VDYETTPGGSAVVLHSLTSASADGCAAAAAAAAGEGVRKEGANTLLIHKSAPVFIITSTIHTNQPLHPFQRFEAAAARSCENLFPLIFSWDLPSFRLQRLPKLLLPGEAHALIELAKEA